QCSLHAATAAALDCSSFPRRIHQHIIFQSKSLAVSFRHTFPRVFTARVFTRTPFPAAFVSLYRNFRIFRHDI
ncbi:MAG: hypothetical protein WCK89_22865, partial [bacterium]